MDEIKLNTPEFEREIASALREIVRSMASGSPTEQPVRRDPAKLGLDVSPYASLPSLYESAPFLELLFDAQCSLTKAAMEMEATVRAHKTFVEARKVGPLSSDAWLRKSVVAELRVLQSACHTISSTFYGREVFVRNFATVSKRPSEQTAAAFTQFLSELGSITRHLSTVYARDLQVHGVSPQRSHSCTNEEFSNAIRLRTHAIICTEILAFVIRPLLLDLNSPQQGNADRRFGYVVLHSIDPATIKAFNDWLHKAQDAAIRENAYCPRVGGS